MDETLDKALFQVFGGAINETIESGEEKEESPGGILEKDLLGEANKYFERAMEAQRSGNWSLYGEEIEKLRKILGQ